MLQVVPQITQNNQTKRGTKGDCYFFYTNDMLGKYALHKMA